MSYASPEVGPSTTELSALGLHRPPLADVLARHLHASTAADADGHAGQYFRASGGEALLLAESMTVADFIGLMRDSPDRVVRSQGRMIDEITEDENEYYGLDAGDFPEPSGDGRVLILLCTP
jgi:hypothetical protein